MISMYRNAPKCCCTHYNEWVEAHYPDPTPLTTGEQIVILAKQRITR